MKHRGDTTAGIFFERAEGGLFVAGGSLMSAQTVLPALITRLGGGNIARRCAECYCVYSVISPANFCRALHTDIAPEEAMGSLVRLRSTDCRADDRRSDLLFSARRMLFSLLAAFFILLLSTKCSWELRLPGGSICTRSLRRSGFGED